MALCLSEYIGKGTRKNPYRTKVPGAAIDLRPDCSKREGYALVNTDEPVKRWKLGDGFQDTFGYRIRNALHSRMGVDISAVKRFDVLAAKLLMEPNGWNPLQANPFVGRYEIWLGGLVWEFPLIQGGAYDDFNRPNGAIGDPWQVSGIAGDIDTTPAIISNVATNSGGGGGASAAYYISAATSGAQYAEATLGGRDSGIIVRATIGTTAFNGYLFEGFAGSFNISKMTNGLWTNLLLTSTGAPSTEVRRLEASGSSLTAYRAGVQDGSPTTDTTYTTGQPGFIVQSGGVHTVDNWKGGDLGTTPVSFAIANGNDDGTGYRQNTSWASIGSGAFTAESTANIWASKVYDGSTNYFEDVAWVRFDTSSIPDNAIIKAARLKFWAVGKADSANNFALIADYYDFGGEPSVAGDWIQTASPNILESYDLTAVLSGAWNVQEITDLRGINKVGYTGIRLTLDAAATPTTDNHVEMNAFESGAGLPVVTLDVDYTVPASNWGLLQSNAKTDSGNLAFTWDVQAGSYLVVAHEVNGSGSPTDTAPTDTLGTTYTEIRPQVISVNLQLVSLWGGIAPSSGPNTVNVSLGSAGGVVFDGMVIAEFAYVGGLTAVVIDDSDDNHTGTISAGTDVIVGDAMTPTTSDELALMVAGTDDGGNPTVSDGSTMTVVRSVALESATTDRLTLAYATVTGTPGSFTPKLTCSAQTAVQILEALVSAGAAPDNYVLQPPVMIGG